MDSLQASVFGGMTSANIVEYGVKLMIIFLIVPIHEYAHAWSAVKLGDNTPKYQGRLTLNPLAHVDVLGAICLFLGGFGWGKPVQINPLNFRQMRRGSALCAAAGPLSNLIVGAGGMIIYKILYYAFLSSGSEAIYWLRYIVYYFTIVNFGLAVFNLIPLPPLDGSKIVAYFAGPKFSEFIYRYQMQMSIALVALVVLGALSTPLTYVQNFVWWVFDKATFFIDIIGKALTGAP